MRFIVPMLCGAVLIAGSVEASAQERRHHSGSHMRNSGSEHHMGPRASERHRDGGYRNVYSRGYHRHGAGYGYTTDRSEYRSGLAYGYRASSVRRLHDHDDCE